MERTLRDKLPGGEFTNVSVAHSGRMRAIKEKGNKSTEARVRALLVRAGVRGWTLHPPGLPGKPDFLFPEDLLVIFVDGCYWHGCPRCGHVPRVNRPYWSAKLAGNQRRDRDNVGKLRDAGYRVLRVWEHELLQGLAGPWLETLKELLCR
jgi:DNA mismatch endonuclease (patch repair protein)